ncbi:MAG TPA: lyase family protein, partial [Thermoanaerobaculia bacterium]|nr:lyase family protein [Thermoanaerobaculia bacterium]
MTRLWDKGIPLDERVLRYTAGEDHALDERLVAYDIRASIAHAEMLTEQNLLAADDLAAIRAGLEALGTEHTAGAWKIEMADEDCHTALERRLTERIGPAGARIHLGRSRNDQVLAALRLYLRDAVASLAEGARAIGSALDDLAARHLDVPLPGYTHMQPAMPSTVVLWAGGFACELRDDADGFEAALRRIDKNPLGSAAGYGVPAILPIDREATRAKLGFRAIHQPATAVQLSRGK